MTNGLPSRTNVCTRRKRTCGSRKTFAYKEGFPQSVFPVSEMWIVMQDHVEQTTVLPPSTVLRKTFTLNVRFFALATAYGISHSMSGYSNAGCASGKSPNWSTAAGLNRKENQPGCSKENILRDPFVP